MRKSLAILAVALAATGCSSEKKPAAPEAATKAPAATKGAVEAKAEAPAAPAVDPAQAERDARVGRITTALREAGLQPRGDEILRLKLGTQEACNPIERRRYNLEAEEMYVIVGTYSDEQAAAGCIDAYSKFLGGLWDQFKGDFYTRTHYVIELNPKMPADQKALAKKAVHGAL